MSKVLANPGTTITWNDAKLLTFDATGVVHAATLEESVLCEAATTGNTYRYDPGLNGTTLPMQKTGLPAIAGLISVLAISGGLVYERLKK